MFSVRAPGPQLWKVTTLDRFDGLRFVRSGAQAASEEDLPLPLNDRWYSFATFTILGLSSELLPAEQGTTAGVNFPAPVRYDQDGTVRVLGPPARASASYTVLSYVPRPTPAELSAAPRTYPRAYLRYTDFDLPTAHQSGLRLAATDPARPGRYFTPSTVGAPAPGLPPAAAPSVQRRILASPYGPMYRLARRLAGRTRSTYATVHAVQLYLEANYAYSEQPPERRYPLESFLFEDYNGYCQQFSGAMALMLRMLGIPARVAAGFLPGVYDSATGSYQVRAVDAHSWVEVYFSGVGWVPFDPTPPRSDGTPVTFPRYVSQHGANFDQAIAATVGGAAPFARNHVPTVPSRVTSRPGAAGRAVMVGAALACLVAVLALATRWLAGLVRLRRSLAGDGELATVELARALRQIGYAVAPSVTLAQIERLVDLHGGPDAARYVRLLRERRYTPSAAATATLRERRRMRLGLTVHLGLDARLRGLWALPPGTTAWRLRPSVHHDRPGGP
jgi:transglutaminase-like putative cysteine protease